MRNRKKVITLLALCAALSPGFNCTQAPAQSTRLAAAAGLPQGPLIHETEDGKDFIDFMVRSATALRDYSFEYEISHRGKGKWLSEKGRFYFKKPRLMRLEETGDWKRGAVAVLQADGKVRAHLGGALKFFVVTLPPDSSELLSVHGYPMVESDFASLALFLKNWLSQGVRSRVSVDAIPLDGTSRKVKVLEMFRDENPGLVLKRVLVDVQTGLPAEWYDYVNGQLDTRSVWTRINANPGLADTLFSLGAKE